MDFFQHQDQARKHTSRLVALFVLAVVGIIAAVYVAVSAVLLAGAEPGQATLWHPALLLTVGLGTIAVVALGSLYKLALLRAGGRVVAESLGGSLVAPDHPDNDPDTRKLLNVVEEMAIASGVPTPPVYVLEQERGINAFAAGFSLDDAVVGVTRGCIANLSRDQLQGVVAHEFSHILNGDMRINLRLIGVLHGILLLGLIGLAVLRSLRYARLTSSRSNRKEGGGGLIVGLFLIGLALTAIGFIGVFFGNLIKAAVSRQREFLADAAAVQFTRNPDGIAGALKKIGSLRAGSLVQSPAAPEASHLFFSQGLTSALGSLTATHPPLNERIRRLDPSWDGSFAEPAPRPTTASRPQAVASLASPAMAQIGQPTAAHLDYAQRLLAGVPAELAAAAHEPYSARVVLYAMLLSRDAQTRAAQVAALRPLADGSVLRLLEPMDRAVTGLEPAARLPVIDLAVSSLRGLSESQRQALRRCLDALIAADRKVDLFEWMIRHVVEHRLRDTEPGVRHATLPPLREQVAALLGALARVGAQEREQAQRALKKGWSVLGLSDPPALGDEAPNLASLDRALTELAQSTPAVRRKVLQACAACVSADRQVTVREAELFRAIAAALDCPIPPLLPGQPLA